MGDVCSGSAKDVVDFVREPPDAVFVSWTRRLHADDGVVVVVGPEDTGVLAITAESGPRDERE